MNTTVEINKSAGAIRVAAVQMESLNGQIEANLRRATGLVEQAKVEGAEIILLPELLPTGYSMTSALWEAAEPKEGPTTRWLKNHSRKLEVWLGTSFLEAEGEDFYNTFVLTAPDGEEAGRVRKQTSAVWEAFFIKGEKGSHLINTPLGRIGIGICYENLLCYFPQLMYHHEADLVLMPHSAPMPMQNALCSRKYLDFYENTLKECAQRTAHMLGVPAVMANKCGLWQTSLPPPFPPQDSRFPGLSAIADSDGSVKANLGDQEGIIVADVILVQSRKVRTSPDCYGRWAIHVAWQTRFFRLIEILGRRWYSRSNLRKEKTRKVSSAKDVSKEKNIYEG